MQHDTAVSPDVGSAVAEVVRPGVARRTVASPFFLVPELAGALLAGAAATLYRSADAAMLAIPAFVVGLLLVLLVVRPVYDRLRGFGPIRQAATVSACTLALALAAGWPNLRDVRTAVLATIASLLVPTLWRLMRLALRRPQETLLVGDRVAVTHLIAQWGPRAEVRIAGICLVEPDDDVEDLPTSLMGFSVVGGLDAAAAWAVDNEVAMVVMAPGPVLTAYDVRRLSWALERSGVELAVAAEVHGAVPRRIQPRLLGRRLLLSVAPSRRLKVAAWSKVLLDKTVAAVLLVLLAPLLLMLIVLVRRDSPGAAIFRQVRAGHRGVPFTMYKLRTMSTDAEQRLAELTELNEAPGPLFKITGDPRTTRVGRMLRALSLDELPQLVNVLKGDMSLIGPRPALPRETDDYDDWISRRLSVKPGMTGLWQVSGRSQLGWNETVRLDLDYVDNWTLAGDLAIAGRTVNAVLRRDGAS
ncbi:MAG: exopolysaccharide biosynthesis polyprenyl glycosylphosphotransferase [Pseudonocardiales bacterium]|nr:exopolysaccharide biosynthesis polyprenyl glycosylphosphotransferase [Pseudonocardiales bacterium]